MGDLVKINILSLNSLTQQNSIKELDTIKANRCIASCSCFYQNTTLEHTAEAGGQQACTFHASMKGHTSLPISEPQRKRKKKSHHHDDPAHYHHLLSDFTSMVSAAKSAISLSKINFSASNPRKLSSLFSSVLTPPN